MTAVPAFAPDAGEPAYAYSRVADHVAARVIAGDLRLGARLPGERDLAAEYGAALGTVRRGGQRVMAAQPPYGAYLSCSDRPRLGGVTI